MKRSVVLAIFVVTVGVLAGGMYLALPSIAGWMVRDALAEKGFRDAHLQIEALGLTQAVITDIDLGAESNVRARRITVDYSPGRLAAGIIDGLKIENPEVPLALGPGGADLGALEKLVAADPAEPPGPQFRLLGPLRVTAGLVSIATPLGEVDAAVEGIVLMTDGIGSDANIQFALQHPKARVSGRMRGILDAEEQMQLTLDIQNASSDSRVAFDDMEGAVRISGGLGTSLNGGGSLTLQNVRVDGVALGNVDLVGEAAGQAATLELLMGGTGTGLSVQLRAETDDMFDPASRVRLTGEAATDGLKGPFELPLDADVIGALSFDVAASRRDLQALPSRIVDSAIRADDGIAGMIDVTHLGGRAQNGLNATLDGKLDLAVDRLGWRLQPRDGLNFDAGLPAGGVERRLDLSLGRIDGVPFLAGGPSAADPLRMGMIFDGVYAGWLPFSGDAGGAVWPATTDGIVLEDVALRFDPWQMQLGGLDVIAEQVGMRISGPLRELDVEVAADARFAGKLNKTVGVSGGHVSLAGNVGHGPDGFRVFSEACTDVRAARLDFGDAVLRPGPLSICPISGGAPLIHAVTDAGGLKRIDVAAIVKSLEIALQGVGPYPVSGMLPRLEGEASFDAVRSTWWAKLLSRGGRVTLEGPDVAVADVASEIALEGRDSLLGARMDLRAAHIVDQRRPLRFTPLSLSGKGQYQPSAVTFKGQAALDRGPSADIDARYRMAEKRGAVQIDMPTWTISPESAQPQQLLPVLAGLIADVKGDVEAGVRIGWTPSRTTSTARIRLADVAFGTTPAEVAGLDAEIAFDDLLALKTDGTQTLRVGLLDVGLPLIDGEIAFSTSADDGISIDRAHWPLSGGALEVSGLNIPFDGFPDMVIANLKGLDAAELAESLEIEGLQAEGKLAGSIPVRIADDGPVIDDARIWSLGGGVLRFRSQVALAGLKQSGEMADLLARALDDFRYTKMEMSLNGPLSGDITAKAKINGANPELYEGKRIELNVTLQGALRDLLQSASVIQDIPGDIRDQVQGRSGKP